MYRFEISENDRVKVDNWLQNEVYPKVVAKQRASTPNPNPIELACWEDGYPYTGAIGGGLTYEFSPTSLGLVTKVRYFEHELNLTNYGDW